MHNHLRNYPCTTGFILVVGLKKIKYFHFPIVKMAAKYAKFDRSGSLDADIHKVPLVRNFLKYSQYCNGTSIIQNY